MELVGLPFLSTQFSWPPRFKILNLFVYTFSMKKLLLVSTFLLMSLNSELHSAEVGNWSKDFYVDEFGDNTQNAFISLTVKGKYSNSFVADGSLRVEMYISNADVMENMPEFNFYQNTHLLTSGMERLSISCRYKNQDNIISNINLRHSPGHTLKITHNNEKIRMMFAELIANEGIAKFSCTRDSDVWVKYMFKFDFNGYNEILKQFNP